jgi:flagellar biosynthesis protein FlhF
MQPIPFIAASAEEAVAQIRARLGPEAVVLNVRPLPPNGLARLWQKPMIEVLAHKPQAPDGHSAPVSEALAVFRQELNEMKQQVERSAPKTGEIHVSGPEIPDYEFADEILEPRPGGWRLGSVLQQTGLLPLYVQHILDQLRARHGDVPPTSLGREIGLLRSHLAKLWRAPPSLTPNSVHVVIGPAGSGKTTYLCKWLTQAALVAARSARVWRLDGATANMAESLGVYCEILGVPTERVWQPLAGAITEDLGFIDLPGTDWQKPASVKELAGYLKQFGSPHVHLVLNGAYETSVLLAQARAFAALPVEDLVLSHLDEESRWGKIWNLMLGTKFSIRHFSTGQNIPGDFCDASAEMILSRQFPTN